MEDGSRDGGMRLGMEGDKGMGNWVGGMGERRSAPGEGWIQMRMRRGDIKFE